MTKYLNITPRYRRRGFAKILRHLLAALVMAAACSPAYCAGFLVAASPGLSGEQGESLRQAVAELLGRATGREFEYAAATSWPRYIEDMKDSKHGLFLDEPHLVSWRVRHRSHVTLARLPGTMSFVIAARQGDDSVVQLSDIAGRPVCADEPPALDGLILFEQFDNPGRQPRLIPTTGFEQAYEFVTTGRCVAAVLKTGLYGDRPGARRALRILYLSNTYPNWTLSADDRIPGDVIESIRSFLSAAEDPGGTDGGESPGTLLIPAAVDEYEGLDRLLDDFWGLL